MLDTNENETNKKETNNHKRRGYEAAQMRILAEGVLLGHITREVAVGRMGYPVDDIKAQNALSYWLSKLRRERIALNSEYRLGLPMPHVERRRAIASEVRAPISSPSGADPVALLKARAEQWRAKADELTKTAEMLQRILSENG